VWGRDLLFLLAFLDYILLDGAVQIRLLLHNNLPARHSQIDSDVKSLSLLAVLMRNFDHHAASHNAVIKV
jgi:hypothetical protein